MQKPFEDDGQDVPLRVNKQDAFALLLTLLHDKETTRFVIQPHDFKLEVDARYARLFEQLIKGIYPDCDAANITAYDSTDRQTAELRDLDILNKIGKEVATITFDHLSKTEARQRIPDLGVDPKLEQHLTRLFVQQTIGTHSL